MLMCKTPSIKKQEAAKKRDLLRVCVCYWNYGRKLERAGENCTHEFLVADLNRSTHLCVLLAEDVSQTLEQNTRLDKRIKRQTLLPLRVIAVQQTLDEVR